MIQLRLHSVNVLQRCFGLTPISVDVAPMIEAGRTHGGSLCKRVELSNASRTHKKKQGLGFE